MKRIFLALLVLYLCGCSSPDARREKLEALAGECLIVGSPVGEVKGCLANKGIEELQAHGNMENFQSCGAWWYPMVASCSGIVLTTENRKLIEFKVWGQLDGV